MVGTVLSIIVAIILFLNSASIASLTGNLWLPVIMVLIPTLLILGQTFVMVYCWNPLQRAEVRLTSHIVDTFSKDSNIRWTNIGLLLFLFVSYLLVLDFTVFKNVPFAISLIIWTVMLGIAIDLKIHTIHKILKYLNPFALIEIFAGRAQASIRDSNEIELCKWIDSFTETAIKAIDRNSTSLTVQSVNKLSDIIKTYLEAEKSLSHHEEVEAKEIGVADPISFMLFFIFQRVEMIYRHALRERLEPICTDIMALLGKATVYASEVDITLTSYPIHYIGKFVQIAQENQLQEVAEKTQLTLIEVSKAITQEPNLDFQEIKDPFLSIINYMDAIAKETFRQNKDTNIKLLMQPFKELRALFTTGAIANHRDTPSILQNIDRVIAEFTTLETVLTTMPPLPKEEKGA